jgi:membrane-associated phospholipid phosphatase
LRQCERLLAVFFLYTTVLAFILPLRAPIPLLTVGVNAAVVTGLAILRWIEPRSRREFFRVMRDWYPMPLMLLGYREMGWFAPAHHTFELEKGWIVWDRLLLNHWGLGAAIEALGPALPSALEISYSLVYGIPVFSMAMLYLSGKRERADRFLTTFLLATLAAYVLFPIFPSEPPRTVFPGQDMPSFDTIFRRFNQGLVGGYGIHTSVFPSAHVSGAFGGALAMLRILPERRWVGRTLMGLAILIATATVYGRYHYAVDAVAGLGLAVGAEVISRFSFSRQLPKARV